MSPKNGPGTRYIQAGSSISLFFHFFSILRRMGKNKAGAPTLPRIRYMPCFDLTHAPVVTAARAAATGLVSMSTRPDPEGSGTVEIATRRCPRLRIDSVGLARAHPLQFCFHPMSTPLLDNDPEIWHTCSISLTTCYRMFVCFVFFARYDFFVGGGGVLLILLVCCLP